MYRSVALSIGLTLPLSLSAFSGPPDTLYVYANADILWDQVTSIGDGIEIRFGRSAGVWPAAPDRTLESDKRIVSLRYGSIDPSDLPEVEAVFADGSTDRLITWGERIRWRSRIAASKPARSRTIDDMPFELVFTEPIEEWGYVTPFMQSVMMDVDGDGLREWLCWDKAEQHDTVAYLYIYRNHEGDSWTLDHVLTNNYYISGTQQQIGFRNLCAADFDEDGLIEVYFRGGNSGWWWKFTGPGEYQLFRTNLINGSASRATVVDDFNNDGVPDITSAAVAFLPDNTSWTVETHQFGQIHWEEDPPFVTSWVFYRAGGAGSQHNQVAVGDFDHDGINEVALNYLPSGFPTEADSLCYYLDFDEDYNYTYEAFVSSASGFQNKPLIEDLDGDGEDEWYQPGNGIRIRWNMYGGVYRVIEADASGELVEVCMDTTLLYAFPEAVGFSVLWGLPTVASVSINYLNDIPTLNYSVVSYSQEDGYFLQDFSWVDMNTVCKSVYLLDYDEDGLTNMAMYASGPEVLLAVFEETSSDVNEPGQGGVEALPGDFAIGNPFPNPTNSMVNVVVQLPHRLQSDIRVLDVLGREITRLHVPSSPGMHRVVWDARSVSSGTYFLRWSLKPNDVKKVVVVK